MGSAIFVNPGPMLSDGLYLGATRPPIAYQGRFILREMEIKLHLTTKDLREI
jgi:hypothetical protein